MASNKVALQVRFEEQTYTKLKKISSDELRSLNAQIEYFVIKGIQQYEEQHNTLEKANI
ncbi:MAG: hypothetical protein II778_00275 [Anaerovibrio sp.]|uniref:hypothetical protein n=1 Tax=uncultured Anaerovibrio sp. TaxID=361586 RepID=UPI0025E43A8A|nr:hypothetical protein [uncultured Anaerovibrio sp.]MBQ3853117.1 hypothetical protein [Anaerovibrio sp.]